MTFQVTLYIAAIVLGVVAALIAAFAYLFHRREFWKIRQWEQMRVDQKTMEGLRKGVEEHQGELERVVAQVADARTTIEESEVARNFLEQQSNWKAEKEALEKSYVSIGEQVRTETERLAAAQTRWGELQAKNAALQEALKRLDQINEECEALGKRKLAAEEENKRLNEEKATLERGVSETETKAEEIKKQLKKVSDDLAKASGNLEAAVKAQRQAVEDRNKAISDKGKIDHEIGNLTSERDSLKETITNLRKLLDDIKKTRQGTVEIAADAFAGLYKPVLQGGDQIINGADRPNEQERDCLGRLTAHVEERGFVFSERLLYAFHTALKTSDISCLTVMAGVSGTGKSALPKLYAEALGIHFILLAVEPRWDSPRDLFGFFNYMENRYEPTSLARALVQFNAYETNSQKEDLSGQMLMVLLDEMNLARIEYYFSEYLSKLELRREESDRIVDADSDGYLKVSMELFAGRRTQKGQAEDPIHLFAGSNVLFLGTMNEDETTQSLSDKVIDRANVIHFSRPLKLQNRSEGSGSAQVANARLGADAWASWQRVANDTDERMRDHVERLNGLNEILGHIGRPFAHRTYQAMLAYVANYPHENLGQRALADQIAMRVMPKLRGLDLDQHKDQLSQIAGHIRGLDAAVSRAFDSAMNNKQGFFRWQGIDWDYEGD
jgi:hypothetical protein